MESCFISLQSNPAAKLIGFFFPYAGGGRLAYQTWPRFSRNEIEMKVAVLPGREHRLREPACSRIEVIVESLLESIVRTPVEKPFFFFGHSLGALIGFELARALKNLKRPQPIAFFASASKPPQQILPSEHPLHRLSDEVLLARLKEVNGTPHEVLENLPLMKLFLPAIRADLSILETYSYTDQNPLDFPIFALGGRQDPEVDPILLEGWQLQTTALFEVQLFEGDHFYLHRRSEEIVKFISNKLNV